MKLISWNVNGLRAVVKKNFYDDIKNIDADIISLQETKLQEGQIEIDLPDYYQYWNYAEKKGYSGVAVFTKIEPLSVKKGMGVEEFDMEGRLLTLEYDTFYLVNCYTPNAQAELKRIDFRLAWEKQFREYLANLNEDKPVILCGDLNVAYQNIDLKNWKSNRNNPGFSDQEREAFSRLLDSGFIDTYRYFYPDKEGAYSWWSYRFNARKNNAGWRIDYFCVAKALAEKLTDATILSDVYGSDHCPVELLIDVR
ncbi:MULTISPECIES: exodeoxyribonuclease III [Vagococcus]|uniref:Exodeoxyribonuclease III n=1 Tax=Vagococcus teuberi TaxID=519472 RepID=A0A1J0A463_9ENTE|nr:MULTISPECIES: exodeoxyribonuclease III [Vagococcus]APB30733.1 exodeoxyribonuclease III [Vagococcus teuberi]RHH69082.1 exodeoxyribonuclease III [Vagococcus sp. AM17-17]